MTTSRIRMTHKYGETPKNVFSDFDWIGQNKKELIAKYGECYVIVYNQQVLGVGATYKEALENAERDLPPEVGEVTPVHHWIGHRHPFLRAYPVPKRRENSVMRIEGYSSYIDFGFEQLTLENVPSVAFAIEIECGEFRGYEKEIWFYLSNLEDFIAELETLEAKRQGEATLKQLSYRDEDSPFRLGIFAIDNVGHFVIAVELQHIHYLGNKRKLFTNKIAVTFEIDPTTLPKILADFRELLAHYSNRKGTTE